MNDILKSKQLTTTRCEIRRSWLIAVGGCRSTTRFPFPPISASTHILIRYELRKQLCYVCNRKHPLCLAKQHAHNNNVRVLKIRTCVVLCFFVVEAPAAFKMSFVFCRSFENNSFLAQCLMGITLVYLGNRDMKPVY